MPKTPGEGDLVRLALIIFLAVIVLAALSTLVPGG
jgi:hypothetical protein